MSSGARARAQFGAETDDAGRFVRQDSRFRDTVTADGSSGFRAAPGRYHLYVSLACPWAHRTIIVRRLKGLEDAISMSVVDPVRDERGWAFREGPGHGPDPVNGFAFLSEAYRASDPAFSGRVTVPVLWDRETGRIVNNESAEIMRMLNSEFDEWGDASVDLYPADLRDEIDAVNDGDLPRRQQRGLPGGLRHDPGGLRGGLRRALRGASRGSIAGCATAATWWASASPRPTGACSRPSSASTSVYVGHFKCNLRRIVDHAALWPYLRDLYQVPGVAETVDFDHIKRHYYLTHGSINPTRIVPKGPALDLSTPHGRG